MSATTIALSAPASLRYLRDAGVHPDALHDVLATVSPATSWTGRTGPEPYYYRTSKKGVRHWVQACVVKGETPGVVHKEYRVK